MQILRLLRYLSILVGVSAFPLLFGSSPASAQLGGESTATGASRAFNPAISVNGLLLSTAVSPEPERQEDGSEAGSGFQVEEVELRATASVDPYTAADLGLSLHGTSGIEIEEVFVQTFHLPRGMGLKAGKQFLPFGRQNMLHTHAYPLIDNNLVNEGLLGEEGLNSVGLALSYLLPLPWYFEATAGAFSGTEGLFAGVDGRDLSYAGRASSLWDLNDATTFDVGVSGVAGTNSLGGNSRALGSDVRLKWRPLSSAVYRAFIWQTEYIRTERETPGAVTQRLAGFSSLMEVRVARRIWLLGRYGASDYPAEGGGGEMFEDARRVSFGVAFVPSEFSALRVQYNNLRTGDETSHQLQAQFNFTIGSHPAHAY